MRTPYTLLTLLAALLLLTGETCEGPVQETPDEGSATETPAPETEAAPDAQVDSPAEPDPAPDGRQGSEVAAPEVEEPSGTTGAEGAPTVAASEAGSPASVGPISELLAARHDGDLPTRETLDAHPDGQEALAWLAAHAEALLTRARALEALALYPTDGHRELLLGYATGTAHSKVRAAAVRALGSWDLDEDAALRERIVALLSDAEVPVAIAAAQSLAGVAAARPALEAVVASEGRPAVVVRAAEASLAE